MLDTTRTRGLLPTLPVSLRLWGNSLARPSDRAESLLLALVLALWVLTVPMIAVLASAAWPGISARVDQARQGVVEVDAVLVAGTPAAPTRMSMPVDHASVARWNAPSGATVEGPVTTPSGSFAGQHLQIWLAPDGAVVARPMTPATACALLVLGALATWLVVGGLLLGMLGLFRRWLDRARDRRWAQEWAAVNAGGVPWTG